MGVGEEGGDKKRRKKKLALFCVDEGERRSCEATRPGWGDDWLTNAFTRGPLRVGCLACGQGVDDRVPAAPVRHGGL